MLSQASQISDERKQKSAHGRVRPRQDDLYRLVHHASVERDYRSDTASFAMKQDMFGDLTTLSLAFANTIDKVGENNGTACVPVITWLGHAQSRSYDIDLVADPHQELDCGREFQRHHGLRDTSRIPTDRFATSIRQPQGLFARQARSIRIPAPAPRFSWRPSTSCPTGPPSPARIRYFRDTWDIVGNTFEIDYTHPISNIWILEGRFRYYKQNNANFYTDLFQYADEY